MPRRLRQTQKRQRKERLVNLALQGGPSAAAETQQILTTTDGFLNLERLVGNKSDYYPPWIVAAGLGHGGVLGAYMDLMRQTQTKALIDIADPANDTAIRAASRGGHLHVVRTLLHAGAASSRAALLDAVSGGFDVVVDVLLQAGASPNDAMNTVSWKNFLKSRLMQRTKIGIVGSLLRAGASPDNKDLLMAAVVNDNYPIASMLLRAGATISIHDMMEAFSRNRFAVVQSMVEHGADSAIVLVQAIRAAVPRKNNAMIDTILDSVSRKNSAMIDTILDSDPSWLDTKPLGLSEKEWKDCLLSYFHRCCQKSIRMDRRLKVIRRILSTGVLHSEVPHLNNILRMAASLGYTKWVLLLLEFGADVHSGKRISEKNFMFSKDDLWQFIGADDQLRVCKHISTFPGKQREMPALAYAVSYNRVEVARELLAHGASPNCFSLYGGTVLIDACRRGEVHIAKALLNAGADADARGIGNATALHYASLSGHPKVVKLLFLSGASPGSWSGALRLAKSAFAKNAAWSWRGDLVRGQEYQQCVSVLERYAVLPCLRSSSKHFRPLRELGNETSDALFRHIAEYITDL